MNAWPTVILVTSLAVISPGADFAMVTRTSLMESRRAGLWVALGIGCGVLIHVAYTLLGLGMVLQRLPWLFNLLKYAGAAYLVWLGISLWRGASHANGDRPQSRSSAEPGRRNALKGHAPGRSLFVLGFLTNALNPKTALFILSLFMQIIGPAVPMPTQLAYGLFVAMAHVLWFALVACFFSAPVLQPKVQAIRPWVDRSLGCVLLVLGLLLIASGTPATSNLMNVSI
ncbi:amino acid transporter [Comamonas testosteroni]|uniref:Amino acid transporter n=1 Tax=Comamonas testosteroni TaxID=285 RepID=A0A0L7N391_COMTE|nr:LysE family transporter [Comamonas testosteroni]KOC28323.1 amino acid transporter [Comamonas testosteroni]KWT68656.1 Threonine efflux protein [Comamonas testosteroni]